MPDSQVDAFLEATLESDVRFGYLDGAHASPKRLNPHVVLNSGGDSMLRVVKAELRNCESFYFAVAFVTPQAIALLKQELVDFNGRGVIVTSDYLGFNTPQAFAELDNLASLGVETRIHSGDAYHPKGYVFTSSTHRTAIFGSANLTQGALTSNVEWNIRVSAARRSDLDVQLADLIADHQASSTPITADWIKSYSEAYVPQARGATGRHALADSEVVEPDQGEAVRLVPNAMQEDALSAITEIRSSGAQRAIVVSATGTGKTIMSAFDVAAFQPQRMLFVVHREQILDRAIQEFGRVLGAPASDFGKLAGSSRQLDRRFVFATVQTLSRNEVLDSIPRDAFDYVLIDEAHRAGAPSYGRVVEHFTPQFMLGMTATPERSDAFNVFELFDFNVAYEIRLNAALEQGMLSPFHYYGVADATFEDGSTVDADSNLSRLTSHVRARHVVAALERYAQAGEQPRGLIFCSRRDEARDLSAELNRTRFRGRLLRTVALTGADSVDEREATVERLEAGEIDYILAVDVFNEGVDIPSLNQVVMLRQTQSAIVFVQQLGRGLRHAPGKQYLVVIDFIGNYANNFLIPIALFGDDSLNKESIRKSLFSADESGLLPGLASVSFDRIARGRVLESLSEAKLDSAKALKEAVRTVESRLGRVPRLHDFLRFESVDPVVLATRYKGYAELLDRFGLEDNDLPPHESRYLDFMSQEAFAAKRTAELDVLRYLDAHGPTSMEDLTTTLSGNAGLSAQELESALRVLELGFATQGEAQRYQAPLVDRSGGTVALAEPLQRALARGDRFRDHFDDLIATGVELISDRYDQGVSLTPGRQYTRKDAARLLLWDSNSSSVIYGYKVHRATHTCPIFVTLAKADDVEASVAYEDEILDHSTMRWFTKSNRTLNSPDVAPIVANEVDIHVFAQKSDAEGVEFYYLGRAAASDARQTTMPDKNGNPLNVVEMKLVFTKPIELTVFDYFHHP